MTAKGSADDPTEDTAARAWLAMTSLVFDRDDRRAEVAAALGISFARVRALRRLLGGGRSLRELAEALNTDAPYASVMVDDLVRQGLVERRADPADRRRKIVVCTPAGEQAARRADEILRRPPEAVRKLPPDDLAALDRILAAVVAAG